MFVVLVFRVSFPTLFFYSNQRIHHVNTLLFVKEDEYLMASDAELDAKLTLFDSIRRTSEDLLTCVDGYQGYIVGKQIYSLFGITTFRTTTFGTMTTYDLNFTIEITPCIFSLQYVLRLIRYANEAVRLSTLWR